MASRYYQSEQLIAIFPLYNGLHPDMAFCVAIHPVHEAITENIKLSLAHEIQWDDSAHWICEADIAQPTDGGTWPPDVNLNAYIAFMQVHEMFQGAEQARQRHMTAEDYEIYCGLGGASCVRKYRRLLGSKHQNAEVEHSGFPALTEVPTLTSETTTITSSPKTPHDVGDNSDYFGYALARTKPPLAIVNGSQDGVSEGNLGCSQSHGNTVSRVCRKDNQRW